MPKNFPAFQKGERVEIIPSEPYKHDVPVNIVEISTLDLERFYIIKGASVYHGGDVLYELHEVEGYIREEHLRDALISDDWVGYDLAVNQYLLETVIEGEGGYICVIRKNDQQEILRLFSQSLTVDEEKIKQTMELRCKAAFDQIFNIFCEM